MQLPVTNIQRFSVHDGPGIRTTVFLKGCPLRCRWCHNPETQETKEQILYTRTKCIGCGQCVQACSTGAQFFDEEGNHRFRVGKCVGCLACASVCPSRAIEPAARRMTPEEIFAQVRRDMAFYGEEGGLTLSGGEPLLHPEGCLALLRMAREAGLSTAVETAGLFDGSYIPALAEQTDWFLWDYKDSDPVRHRRNTGVAPDAILRNLRLLDEQEVRIELRCILLRGINMEEAHYEAIARLAASLRHITGVRVFPYHAYGGSKNEQLGYGDNGRKDWIPSDEEMAIARGRLTALGVRLL